MSRSQTGVVSPEKAVSEEESSDEETVVRRDTTKRKADTDHKNNAFNLSLQERLQKDQDFLIKNKLILRSMG